MIVRVVGWVKDLRSTLQVALFGYDFFIAYRSLDASTCAKSLYEALNDKGFDCFLDALHYEAGNSLSWMQTAALRRSTKLLVVVSPAAHGPPQGGTDWLLKEVREFKAIARSRRTKPAIVPIGTSATLDPKLSPKSALLTEIPTPEQHEICIFDSAVERNAPIEPATADKLQRDFAERRKRTARLLTSTAAVLMVTIASAFGLRAGSLARHAEQEVMLAEAFRKLDRGRELLEGQADLAASQAASAKSVELLRDLGRDPVIALHLAFATDLKRLRARKVAEVGNEVAELTSSNDGRTLLITYDYQAPSGSPEIESILGSRAFGIFDIAHQTWMLERSLGSDVGRAVYDRSYDFVAVELPDHAILVSNSDGGASRIRMSLVDGKTTMIGPEAASKPEHKSSNEANDYRSAPIREPAQLFKVDPADGIDEYSPRLVNSTHVVSPDRRTAVLGTYEGRLILLDARTGLAHGEMSAGPVYAATYRPDSQRAYVSMGSDLWEIDTSIWPGVYEFALPRKRHLEALAVELSDDGSMLAMATTDSLQCRDLRRGIWTTWALPKPIEEVAAFQIDEKRSHIDLVVADDGSLLSVDYRNPSAKVDMVERPGGSVRTVASLDQIEQVAWLADVATQRGTSHVQSVPLLGTSAHGTDLGRVVLRKDTPIRDEDLTTHAIAKVSGKLVIIHGHFESMDLSSMPLSEDLLVIDLADPARVVSHVIFEPTREQAGPDTMGVCRQVTSVLAVSTTQEILVATTSDGIHAIDGQGRVARKQASLFLGTHTDGDQRYTIAVDTHDHDVWLEIRHEGTESGLRYAVPWGYSRFPEFASVAAGGRRAAIASDVGEVLLLDVGATEASLR